MIRRRQSLETKINHERWLVSYSDFITLLFAFFVVMYSVSHVNEQKYRQLSTTLESAFSSTSNVDEDSEDASESNQPKVAEVEDIAQDIQESLSGVLNDDAISLSGNEQWVEIELSAGLLFSSGEAELSGEAKNILSPVAEILNPYDNAVAIAGHTDDVPIRNAKFSSNWDLSSARAVSVVNFLAFQGVKPERLSAVGYGEYRPVVANTDDDSRSRNRRVVIRIAQEAAPPALVPVNEFSGDAAVQDEERGETEGGNTPEGADSEQVVEPEVSQSDNLQPVRLQGGGLLFSSDPDLPRTNPPVIAPEVQDTPSEVESIESP